MLRLWLASLLLGGLATAASAATQVYRPAHRPAEELLPIARVSLGDEGSVAVDPGTNALILVGEESALRSTVELLTQQDRALRNVVVRYESRTSSDFAAAGVTVDWRVVAGDVRIGTLPGPGRASVLAIRPEAGEGSGGRRFAGTLRILEGRSGQLVTGSELPVTTREVGPYGVRESTSFVRAESGFDVTPRVLGDGRVQLDIAPFSGRFVGGSAVLERSAAASSVIVAPGESVVLGQLASEQSAREAGTRGVRGGSSHEETLLVVGVELE